MTAIHSIKARPPKPYPEFPLYAHNNGQWARRIRGKLYSFGKWDDPTAALEKHNREYAYLKEGISPPDQFDGWRVGELVNEFLSVQEDRLRVGEIGQRTFDGLKYCGKLLVEYIDKNEAVEALEPADFRKLRLGLVEQFAPTNTRVNMTRIRSIFKFALDERLISRPGSPRTRYRLVGLSAAQNRDRTKGETLARNRESDSRLSQGQAATA